jgi:hypothetical protein
MDGRVGWNFDPQSKRFLSKQDALARGLRPPPKQPRTPPPTDIGNTPSETQTTQMSGDPPAPPRSNVVPFGRVVTLGDVLNMASSAPAPPGLPGVSPPGPPPAAPALGTQPPAVSPTVPAPLGGGGALVPQPGEDAESTSDLGGKVGAAVAEAVLRWAIRRQGYQPNDPDDDETEQLERGIARGIRLKLGDAPMPWWGPILAALALLYLSMRNGARKLEPEAPSDAPIIRPEPKPAPAPAPAAAAPSSPPAASAPAAKPAPPPNGKPGPIAHWSQAS